jgi:heme-degrading monooxygenase HmoA
MLCAHTVRRLKPGTFDQFAEAFRPGPDDAPPPGWVRFVMLRPLATPDEDLVVTFGFFDGTLEELEASQHEHGYADRIKAAQPYIEFVVANGVYDVAVDARMEGSPA